MQMSILLMSVLIAHYKGKKLVKTYSKDDRSELDHKVSL